MAVVTTEESYTSKTSFVNGDTLESFEEKEKARSAGEITTAACKTGKRATSDRNRFVHENRVDRWQTVHSDVNGAFNILRKVFTSFKYHVGLTLKYTIYRLSSRLGVVGMLAT
jgi:transposase